MCAHPLSRLFHLLTLFAAVCMCAGLDAAAHAATQGPALDPFYAPPTQTPAGPHGVLLRWRRVPMQDPLGSPATTQELLAWQIIYRSQDSRGNADWVSGLVLRRPGLPQGWARAPVLIYAPATHGLSPACAPSRNLPLGKDYELANVLAAVAAGMTVLVPDYQGYLQGQVPTYLAGKDQGHAVLDAFAAAQQLPDAQVSADAPVAIWGYSQGGQSAAWAAEDQPAYAPHMRLKGVAAGGIPAQMPDLIRALNGQVGFGFLASGIVGWNAEYPGEMPLAEFANERAKQDFVRLTHECVFEALLSHQGLRLDDFMKRGSWQALMALPRVHRLILEQALGHGSPKSPMLIYHGRQDEFVPPSQSLHLRQSYCEHGISVRLAMFPSEHIVTQFQAAQPVLRWLEQRLLDAPEDAHDAQACRAQDRAPDPIAGPAGGHLTVHFDAWPFGGRVQLKTLRQDIHLPASTFSATADLTQQRLHGTMHVPAFHATLEVLHLPIDLGLSIQPVGAIDGRVSLDKEGRIHIRATSLIHISVNSLAGIPLFNCRTSEPVRFELRADAPVSDLANGLHFSGLTRLPSLGLCPLSPLVIGDAQAFRFDLHPPAYTVR